MERSERARLEVLERNLRRELVVVQQMLKTAHPPRRLSDRDIRERALAICAEIRKRGGSVDQDVLRTIVSKRGMPFTAVGSLYSGGYLRKTKTGVALAGRSQRARQRKRR